MSSSRKRSRKSTLVVHSAASPSLQRIKTPPITQQKHIGFALKQRGIHVTTGYVASSKTASPPIILEELTPVTHQWMDPSEKVLWESIMSPDEPSMAQEIGDGDDTNLNMSIHHCEAYLEEMMNHEGRGYNPPDLCADCHKGPAVYQCRSCFGQDLLCQACIVHCHTRLPFHRVRVSQYLDIAYLRSNRTAMEWNTFCLSNSQIPWTKYPVESLWTIVVP